MLDDDDDDLELPRLPSLAVITPEDRSACQKVVVGGSFEALRYVWTKDRIREFAARPEIQAEIDIQRTEYAQRTGIQEREQFFTTRNVNSIVPHAVNILAKAMKGDKEDPITTNQLKAACKVIDTVNAAKYGGQDQVPVIDARQFITNVNVADSVVSQMSPAERQAVANIAKRVKLKAQVQAAEAASEIKEAEVVIEEKPVERVRRPLPPRKNKITENEA